MTDEERMAMLQQRIVRLMRLYEFGEAADLLADYRALRRKQMAAEEEASHESAT